MGCTRWGGGQNILTSTTGDLKGSAKRTLSLFRDSHPKIQAAPQPASAGPPPRPHAHVVAPQQRGSSLPGSALSCFTPATAENPGAGFTGRWEGKASLTAAVRLCREGALIPKPAVRAWRTGTSTGWCPSSRLQVCSGHSGRHRQPSFTAAFPWPRSTPQNPLMKTTVPGGFTKGIQV